MDHAKQLIDSAKFYTTTTQKRGSVKFKSMKRSGSALVKISMRISRVWERLVVMPDEAFYLVWILLSYISIG